MHSPPKNTNISMCAPVTLLYCVLVPFLMLSNRNITNYGTHKMKKGRCCFVDDKYVVTCEDDNIQNDKEFILNIQKAMLVTLFESKKINHFQYEYAIELLEKNFRKK